MIWVSSNTACELWANEGLIFSDRTPIQKHEMIEETQQNRLFQCLQVQIVNESYGLFQDRSQVIVDQFVTVPEYFTDELPWVHTIFHVINERIDIRN